VELGGGEAGTDGSSRAALRDVSLEVARGERLAIVGPSGAGKTTLLKAVAGLVRPSAGRIEIGGLDAGPLPPERRGAVYLHQTPLLFPHLDVFENVAFPLRVRGIPEPDVRRRVQALLDAVRLPGFGPRRPGSLSGGQRSRVALARAAAADPLLLLLDEPLSALDPALRDEVRRAILALHAGKEAGLVVVTHDLDEAGLLADRIGVLIDGSLAQLGDAAEVFTRPASLAVARLLGLPNEVPGRVRADGSFECVLGVVPPGRTGLDAAAPVADGPPPRSAPPAGPALAVFRAEGLRRAAVGGVRGRVVRVLNRNRGAAARVSVGGLELEVAVDALDAPVPGSEIALELAPRGVSVFPLPPTTHGAREG
jgi:ABC-type sugar transport system ATPase subunit